jgi:hypothetical protein
MLIDSKKTSGKERLLSATIPAQDSYMQRTVQFIVIYFTSKSLRRTTSSAGYHKLSLFSARYSAAYFV